MNGAVVVYFDGIVNRYGFLTADHASSSYGLPVFVPIDLYKFQPTGDPARGPGEVGPLTDCCWVGDLEAREYIGWTEEFAEACKMAGFRWEW